MGAEYPQDLDRLSRPELVEMVRLVRMAMSHVVAALCDNDPPISGALLDAGKALHALRREVEDQALAIRATRAGRTSTLRTVIAAAQVNTDAECIGDAARRLTEIGQSRRARPPVPAELQAILCKMGQVYLEMAAVAGEAMESSTPADPVAEIETANAEVSRLQRLLYRHLLAGSDAVDVDAALDVTLASRYFVRCAEHTVSMARHIALLAGGSLG